MSLNAVTIWSARTASTASRGSVVNSWASMADRALARSGTSTSARNPSLPRFTPRTGALSRSASLIARSIVPSPPRLATRSARRRNSSLVTGSAVHRSLLSSLSMPMTWIPRRSAQSRIAPTAPPQSRSGCSTSPTTCISARTRGSDRGPDDDGIQVMPLRRGEPRLSQQPGGAPLRARLAPAAAQERGHQPGRALVDQDQVPSRHQNPRALGETGPLIRPVVERGGADDEIEHVLRVGKFLGCPGGEAQPAVGGHRPGNFDHRGRRVDTGQFHGLRGPAGQLAQQVAGSASHVKHAGRPGKARQGEVGGPVRDVVMQPAEPAGFVTGGALVEGGDVTTVNHRPMVSWPARSGQISGSKAQVGTMSGTSRVRRLWTGCETEPA